MEEELGVNELGEGELEAGGEIPVAKDEEDVLIEDEEDEAEEDEEDEVIEDEKDETDENEEDEEDEVTEDEENAVEEDEVIDETDEAVVDELLPEDVCTEFSTHRWRPEPSSLVHKSTKVSLHCCPPDIHM